MANKKEFSQYNRREVRNAYAFLLPVLLVIILFILYPVLGTIYTSFFHNVATDPVEKFVFFKNYGKILSDPTFWRAFKFTLLFGVATVVLEAGFGLLFALILNEPMKGRGFLRAVILIPWAVPTIVSAKVWKLIYDFNYGILNHIFTPNTPINWLETDFSAFWALVISDVWKTTPFVVIILLAGLQAIPRDIYKQARIDGAHRWKRFMSITLPLLMPVLAIAMIFRTIDAIRVFDLVYALTGGGPGGGTQTLSYIGYNYFANATDFGMGSAVSVITFIVSLVITLVYVKMGKFGDSIK